MLTQFSELVPFEKPFMIRCFMPLKMNKGRRTFIPVARSVVYVIYVISLEFPITRLFLPFTVVTSFEKPKMGFLLLCVSFRGCL